MGAKVKVTLEGGPRNGTWIEYDTPLPKVLVFSEVTGDSVKYHDYEQVGKREYRFRESE